MKSIEGPTFRYNASETATFVTVAEALDTIMAR
jgi:hypothetical protein